MQYRKGILEGSMSTNRTRSINAKHIFFLCFGLLTLFVVLHNELPLMNAQSPARQHFARVTWWLIPHGIGGALALLLAPLQFSNRLRLRYLRLHRILGRLYVLCVVIAGPVAIPIALIQGPPTLFMAAVMQTSGWLVTTFVALYAVRTGNIKQHREWMIRSYPFAMVFVVARAILALPPIHALGEIGVVSVVWSTIAAAYLLPSFVINWRALFPRRAAVPALQRHAPAMQANPVAVAAAANEYTVALEG
jgi:uncharacterized membrane protein